MCVGGASCTVSEVSEKIDSVGKANVLDVRFDSIQEYRWNDDTTRFGLPLFYSNNPESVTDSSGILATTDGHAVQGSGNWGLHVRCASSDDPNLGLLRDVRLELRNREEPGVCPAQGVAYPIRANGDQNQCPGGGLRHFSIFTTHINKGQRGSPHCYMLAIRPVGSQPVSFRVVGDGYISAEANKDAFSVDASTTTAQASIDRVQMDRRQGESDHAALQQGRQAVPLIEQAPAFQAVPGQETLIHACPRFVDNKTGAMTTGVPFEHAYESYYEVKSSDCVHAYSFVEPAGNYRSDMGPGTAVQVRGRLRHAQGDFLEQRGLGRRADRGSGRSRGLYWSNQAFSQFEVEMDGPSGVGGLRFNSRSGSQADARALIYEGPSTDYVFGKYGMMIQVLLRVKNRTSQSLDFRVALAPVPDENSVRSATALNNRMLFTGYATVSSNAATRFMTGRSIFRLFTSPQVIESPMPLSCDQDALRSMSQTRYSGPGSSWGPNSWLEAGPLRPRDVPECQYVKTLGPGETHLLFYRIPISAWISGNAAILVVWRAGGSWSSLRQAQ